MRKLLILLSCLALAFSGAALAGCGDDDENTAEETAPQSQPQEGQGADSGDAEETEGETKVSVIDNDYDPKDVTIKVGDKIVWTWDGQIPHTVTDRDKKFDSGVLDPGATYERTFDEAGKIDYYCTLHPGQEGTITVE